MQTESLYAVFITLATVLGSAGAWRFYEKRAQYKKEEEDFIKDDCAKRIDRLEELLERSSNEKDDLREKILQLTKDLAELSVKVQYLEKENLRLLELNNQAFINQNLDKSK
jgi:phage shock protein A|tara:strand:+ start:475 stop:807 length:333 start_codon:yes stop_codon:yes gene_type:complete